MVTRKLLAVTRPPMAPTITLVDLLPTSPAPGKASCHLPRISQAFRDRAPLHVYTRQSCLVSNLVTTSLRQAAYASGVSGANLVMCRRGSWQCTVKKMFAIDDVNASGGGSSSCCPIGKPHGLPRMLDTTARNNLLLQMNVAFSQLARQRYLSQLPGTTVLYMWQRSLPTRRHESDNGIIPPPRWKNFGLVGLLPGDSVFCMWTCCRSQNHNEGLHLTFPATVPLAAQSAFLSRPVWTNVRHQMLSTYQGYSVKISGNARSNVTRTWPQPDFHVVDHALDKSVLTNANSLPRTHRPRSGVSPRSSDAVPSFSKIVSNA